MNEKGTSSVWIVGAMLLLLPVVYGGSYLVLARPLSISVPSEGAFEVVAHYRFGGEYAETFFWPLEQLDRWMRPEQWELLYE